MGFVNGLKTFGLFLLMWAVLLVAGSVVGGGEYLWIFALFGIGGSVFSYWFSDKLAIKAMQARPVTEVEQPHMYRIVRELSAEANKPMPRLYVSPANQPNAFATGRNPKNAAVCCTSGILNLLDERELRGVLGHELQHVYNRDILISAVAAAFAGIITMLAQWALFFGGGRDRNVFALIAMRVLAPIAATLIRMAISRNREYEADRSGADLTGDPLALASALGKLERGVAISPLPQEREFENVSHMMIANPFSGEGMAKLFATHPPMDQRIQRLQQMAKDNGQFF